jgi:AcrR family transcriptional regulator
MNAMIKLVNLQERRADLTPKSQKRVEAVLDAARKVFSEFGYEKATTLEIARRLDISEATVFTYFGSKRELCMQVISNWYDEMGRELETELPRTHGTRSQLGYIVHKHLDVLIRDGRGLCALVLTEGRSLDIGFAELLTNLQRRYTAPLMDVLSMAQKSGEIRSDISLRRMRNMVYGSMEHILWESIISGHMPNLETTEHEVMELLWAAFAPPMPNLDALRQLHVEVAGALHRFETAESFIKKPVKRTKKPPVQ